MRSLLQDVSLSLRTLRKSPGFALTAILTLALGIGSVTSVFSIVDSVLLKPFDFEQPDRLVVLRETTRDQKEVPGPDNYQHYLFWRANAKAFTDAAILNNHASSVSVGVDHPEMVGGLSISPNFFSVLGIQPALGRGFLWSEATQGHNDVVILSWSAWQRYFRGDPKAIGRTLRIGGVPQTVVGILPRRFSFPHLDEMATAVSQRVVRPYEIFRPLLPDPDTAGDYNYLVLGRLRPAVSLPQAQSELGGLEQVYARTNARMPRDAWVLVEPFKQEVEGGVSTALWLLLAAVGGVLLIGCINLANLQLARGVARRRELAIRLALGAGRDRLLWFAWTDSLVLAITGGTLGVVASFLSVRLFVAAAPANLPRLSETHVSWPILLAATGLSVLTAFLFGLLPALRSTRVDPQTAMQANPNRIVNTREAQRSRDLLVSGEVACTVVLLVLCGLLVRSFSRVLTQQRSFNSDHMSLVGVSLNDPRYGDNPDEKSAVRAGFLDRALAGLSQLPGVQSVAMTSEMPLAGETWVSDIARPDHPVPPTQEPGANMRWVSPSYVSTLKIPLLAGRDLAASDRDHPTNVLISEQTARSAWPGESPLGKQFTTGSDAPYTVVGVVADARINDLKRSANMVYIPYWQNPWWRAYFFIRSPQPTAALANSIRRTLWTIDPQVTISLLKSMDEQVNDSVATERFQTRLLSAFGGAALFLALLGIYGVQAYSVSLREQEFGLRLALGSGRASLIGLVLRQASKPILGGVVLGLAASLVTTRWIENLLYNTRGEDPVTIAISITPLLLAALAATVVPAWRAVAADPLIALRSE